MPRGAVPAPGYGGAGGTKVPGGAGARTWAVLPAERRQGAVDATGRSHAHLGRRGAARAGFSGGAARAFGVGRCGRKTPGPAVECGVEPGRPHAEPPAPPPPSVSPRHGRLRGAAAPGAAVRRESPQERR